MSLNAVFLFVALYGLLCVAFLFNFANRASGNWFNWMLFYLFKLFFVCLFCVATWGRFSVFIAYYISSNSFRFFFCYIVCLPISMVAVFICSYNKREKPNYHPHTPLVRLEHFSRKYISTTLRNESMFWNKNFNKYVRRYAPTVHSSKNW